MQLSKKNKLSLALTLAVCMCAPLSVFAGANEPRQDAYSEIYKTDGTDAAGANIVVDTAFIGSYKSIYGGYSQTGNAHDNTVTINNGTLRDLAAGNGDSASYNKVIVKGGSISSLVAGASGNGDSTYNSLYIHGGEIQGATAGSSEYGNVSHNSVEMTAGKVTSEFLVAFADVGYSNDNTLIMSGGEAAGANVAYAKTNDAKNNKAYISGTAVINRAIVVAEVRDTTAPHTISGNEIYISGGEVNGVCAARNRNGISILDSNSITISGGQIKGDVALAITGNGTASNNTLTISGGTFDSALTLTGGAAAISTGNRFNVYTSNISVKSVDKFQIYDLAMDKNNTTLTVADALALQSGDTITSSRVLSELNVGDTVSLLKSTGGLTLNGATLVNGKAKQGALYIYGYELKQDVDGVLVADILSKEGNKQTMSVADGQLAAMGMLRSGADLISGSAMATAAQNSSQYDVFATMNYGNYNMNSVSNIDVQGTSMLVGVSRNLQHSNSNTTIGAFLESGWGTYDSELGEAKAKGHTNYYGLGILARNNHNSGLYTEGSIRVGKVGNTYSGHQADDGMYDASSTYYGLHLGIGKINKINENTNIDYYGKYFWAHESGTDATLLGDKFDFDAIDSHRVRVGARLNNTNKNVTRYVGLAYEYEFSGTAKASAYGIDIASPSAKGSSGLLELGATYKPATDSRFSMDVGLNGYVGKRQGVSGNLKLNWAF